MMIMTVPVVTALEQAICFHHYQGAIPSPGHCKNQSIQQTLSEVRGWEAFFDTLVGR
jgi:hypothetical protein